MNNQTAIDLAAKIFAHVRVACPPFAQWEKTVMGEYDGPTGPEVKASKLILSTVTELPMHVHIIETPDRIRSWMIYGERRHAIDDAHPMDKKSVVESARTIAKLMRIPILLNGERLDKAETESRKAKIESHKAESHKAKSHKIESHKAKAESRSKPRRSSNRTGSRRRSDKREQLSFS